MDMEFLLGWWNILDLNIGINATTSWIYLKTLNCRSSLCGSVLTILTRTLRMRVQSPTLLSGLRIWCCCELWCRFQIWLRSHVAVAVALAGRCSSHSTPSLGTSICLGCGPKKINTLNRTLHVQQFASFFFFLNCASGMWKVPQARDRTCTIAVTLATAVTIPNPFFSFLFLAAVPMAYGSSRARNWIQDSCNQHVGSGIEPEPLQLCPFWSF